ncbi:peptide chain release factor N(5)-glutamine methyltransferase [Methylomonas paludis]|uniref:Release factor glutamine methyltransferase n=1 Tax=Methylomonas paludis TaxID=1173101 RepID=A0A975MLY1_9GAMM|nr:peptide chain release factor N(5)-glutamine methyltransferase [Methylomonas paludis]QWF70306.1 peptide chain release factor N(5)-glutamine methyltransferase [Methylomonas paludis]
MPDSIQSLLNAATTELAAASPSAALDAEVLLCHCLTKNRSYLRAWPDSTLSAEQISAFQTLLAQRQQGVPVAYLTGEREFWSRSFLVSPAVLIPRPDSELLIELSLARISPQQSAKIIDLGTGSGILAITLATERPLAQVIGCDFSPAALDIARQNAARHKIDNLALLRSNWFSAITDQDFDLIISNPPYIDAEDPHLQMGDVRFEPSSALISPEQGLADIRLIAAQATQRLKLDGQLLIEHGYNQAQAVSSIFQALNYRNICTHTDLSGQARVTSGLWNPI